MKPKTLFSLGGVVVLSASLSLFFASRQQMRAGTTGLGQVNCPFGKNCQPPPPPPPGVGQLGGPLPGLTTGQTNLFTAGYDTFNIKWDPIRGLGPVFTQAGCYNCHGGGDNVITQCKFNPPGVACVDGGSSNVLGTRYGKWNSDGTFNYLDGTGTFPENEGGPVLHGQSVAQFDTIAGCSNMAIGASPAGITESGTTVTVTTRMNHGFLAGQISSVAGVPVNGYNGNFTILSVPSATTFTCTVSTSGLAGSGGGTANNIPHELVPPDAAVVSTVRSPELYGLGLVDSIPDSVIQANATAECANKGSTGICGVANLVPDQIGNIHVGRFGQKSNFPTLLSFTASAFNNETGITNVYFPVQHLPSGLPYPPKCAPDTNNPEDSTGSFMLQAYQFNELLAPVTPGRPNSAGKTVFENTGCNICHTESMTTGPNIRLQTNLNGGVSSVIAPLSNATANLYSDLLLHDMGPSLSGGIPFQPDQEGHATLTQWRTAPLWGLSTRIPLGLLHDNRAKDLNTAISNHGGEAAAVIRAYQALISTNNANLPAFLGSL